MDFKSSFFRLGGNDLRPLGLGFLTCAGDAYGGCREGGVNEYLVFRDVLGVASAW